MRSESEAFDQACRLIAETWRGGWGAILALAATCVVVHATVAGLLDAGASDVQATGVAYLAGALYASASTAIRLRRLPALVLDLARGA